MTTMERTCREVESRKPGSDGGKFFKSADQERLQEEEGYISTRSGMSGKIYLVSGCFPEFSVRNNILMASFMMHSSTSFLQLGGTGNIFFFSCCRLCHQAFRLPF